MHSGRSCQSRMKLAARVPKAPSLRRRCLLLAHMIAIRVVHGVLFARPRRGGQQERVAILLMHAWGMGGTIRSTLNLGGQLTQQHDVEILSVVRRRNRPFFEFPPDVTVTAVDDQRPSPDRSRRRRALSALPSVLMFPGERASRSCSLWTDVQLVRALWRVRAGVLLATRPALNLLALEARRPGLAVLGLGHMHYAAHSRASRARIRRRYPRLDGVVVLTEEDLDEYRRVLDGSTRLVRIPNAVAGQNGAVSDLARPVIVAAGRLSPQKGFDRLIRAFAKVAPAHPGWVLSIFGRGPSRAALQQLIESHGLSGRVVLMGPSTDFQDHLAQASLFVLSSRFEGLPMVMLEAMRMGIPVVSFDCPTGPREVVSDGRNGILVPNGDIDALAAAIAELIADEDKRRRYGAAAARDAESYSLSEVGAQWEELFAARS